MSDSSKDYLLAIDQGTTGSTVLIISAADKSALKVIGRSTVDFKQHYPNPGWVEHDLNEIWDSVGQAIRTACQSAETHENQFSLQKIRAIGITNQRETVCVFDAKSRKPLHPAIVWQCRRSSQICERLKNDGLEKLFTEKTGLVLDPYFSGTKISWILENHPKIASALKNNEARVGTVDSWLVSQLTQGVSFVTEPSNASRTLLFNIKTGEWDEELAKILGVPIAALPTVQDSASKFGETKGLDFLPDGIPITGVLGDQQAALAGQACFEPGQGKCTYGTGAFMLINQGETPIYSKNGMLTTVAWSLDGKLTYAFEGAAFVAGAALQFLRDQMKIIKTATESGSVARNVTAAPEVYFVPSFVGLGAPHWDPQARGAFLGLTRGTENSQLVRAALEGICFQVCDLIKAIEVDLGRRVDTLNVDGGAAANDLLMQIQADLGQIIVDRPKNLETTAFGAAMMAGLGSGLFSGLDELKGARVLDKCFEPDTSDEVLTERIKQIAGWDRATEAVRVFSGSNA